MAAVLGVWNNAVGELRNGAAGGVATKRLMESSVRLGLLFGWIIKICYVSNDVLTDKTERGFNAALVPVMVFICQSLITYTFIAPILFLTKLIKFAFRAAATAKIRNFFTIGEVSCQVIAGLLWTLMEGQIFETYRGCWNSVFDWNRVIIDERSYYTDLETAVTKVCNGNDDRCGIFIIYSLYPWILLALNTYLLTSILQKLWVPAKGGNPKPPAAGAGGGDYGLNGLHDNPRSLPNNSGSADGPPGPAPDQLTAVEQLRAWIEQTILEILEAEGNDAESQAHRRRRNKSQGN